MGRNGFGRKLTVLVCAIIIIVGVFLWFYVKPNTVDYQLQSSEVSRLVAYLQLNNLQAAVVQKIYDNAVSNWIVKSNGQMIFLDKRNLGYVAAGIGPEEPAAQQILTDDKLEGGTAAIGIYVLQDQAEINEWNEYGSGCDNACSYPSQGTIRDISTYATGHQVDPFWHANPLIASTLGLNAVWGYGNTVSPDGNYIVMEDQSTTIGWVMYPGEPLAYQPYPILMLAKIIKNGNSISYQPITYLPAEEGAEWSTDSRYILLGNEIYDVQQNNGAYVKVSSVIVPGHEGEYVDGDVIAFTDSAGAVMATGTFVYGPHNQSVEFRKGDGSETDILTQSGLFEPSSTVSSSLFLNIKAIGLPNEIKLGGFIQ